MARKNVITILSGCILVCTVLFCTLNAHATNVTAKVQQFTISGSVGVEGVELQGFPNNQSIVTDSSGNYSCEVDFDWSGTIKPIKPGYNFTPPSKSYANVEEDKTNQDYTGKAITYTISGKVGDMADVVLEGLPSSPKTGADGSFSVEVEFGFSAQVTPVKAGFEFNPPMREISSAKGNMTLSFTTSPIKIKISGNAGTKGVEMTGLPGKIISGEDGSYSVIVEYNWRGTVVPKKEGYSFVPGNMLYQNLTTDQTQDYDAKPQQFTISGSTGIANVKMEGLPGETTTDSSGFYSVLIDYDFSGTVTPVLEGYSFKPASITYSKVTADKPNQDYKPSIETFVIKGKVGQSGVTMQGLPGNPVTTGPEGSYSVTVEYSWSGTVAPEKDGYSFQPEDRTYTVVAKNYENENYLPSIKEYTITGNTTVPGVILRGFPGKAVETDASGNYTAPVPHGWKGKVTPSKNGYKFEPQYIDYSDVTGDKDGQNYQSTILKYTISGTVKSDKGKPVEGLMIFSAAGNITTDAQGKYSLEVDYGWTGSIMPNPDQKGYTFTPQVFIFEEDKSVKMSLPNKDFKATIQMFKISDVLEFGPGKSISGVQITANPGDIKTVSNAKGEFTFEVPYGWTGEYTLFKRGIKFDPETKQFTNVTTDYNRDVPALRPETTTTKPETTTTRPETTTTKPETTTTRPETTTTRPETTTTKPETTTTRPETTTKDPAIIELENQLKELQNKVNQSKPTVTTMPGTGEPLVTDQFITEDILTVLDNISSSTNVQILYDDTVQGVVNCNLNQVPLSKALEMVLAGKPYFYKKVEGKPAEGKPAYYLVGPAKTTDPISTFAGITETKRIMLDNISASLAKAMLATPFKDYVQADADPNGRMLTITAPASLMNRIYEDVKAMDLRQLQVLLEARIVVLEKGDLLNLGVEWGWPTIQSGVFANNNNGKGDSTLDFGGKSAWGIQIGYSPDIAFTNALEQVLNLLQVNDEAKILSKPVVFAQNNKMARIEVLSEDYYVLTSNSASNSYYSQSQFETIVTGTVLAITPHIGDENDIDLDMAVEVSNATTNPMNSSFPRVLRRKAESSLRVYDGGTVAIAGLTENRTLESTKKVPLLGDIPVIGRLLFTNNRNEGNSKEIAIFVTASLVHETNPNGQDFTRRKPAAQLPMNNPLSSYPSPSNSVEFNNMTQPAQPRTQSSLTSPNNQNQEPFLGFENNGPQNRRPQPAPSRVSPKDEFNMQLNDSLGTQGRSQY